MRLLPWQRLVVLLAVAGFVGCAPSEADKKAKTKPAEQANHDHDHDHDHAHVHNGPHGGKIAVVGDEKYHLEWTHDDDSGKVALYVLDKDGKKEVAIAAPKLTVVTKMGDKEETFELEAVDRTDDKTAKFELVSKDLLGVMEQLSEKITATIPELEIAGEKFTNVKIEEHDHHDH
jgi:hypothetical protein